MRMSFRVGSPSAGSALTLSATIKHQVLRVSAIASLVSCALLVTLSAREKQADTERAYMERAQLQLELMASLLSQGNLSNLDSIARAAVKDEGIDTVRVENTLGVQIFAYGAQSPTQDALVHEVRLRSSPDKVAGHIFVHVRERAPFSFFLSPLVLLPTVAAFALTTLLLGQSLGRRIVRPLERLSIAMEDEEEPDSRPADLEAPRELQALDDAIRGLVASVSDRDQKLERSNDALERKVREFEEVHAALLHAQKMDAIGQMASGVAHDFNNLLSITLGSLELATMRLDRKTPGDRIEDGDLEYLNRQLNAASDAAARGADLAQTLLGFARKSKMEAVEFDLANTVRKMSKLAAKTLPNDVRIVDEIPDGEFNAFADRNMAENATLNLIINARDAMPDGGRIILALHRETLDRPRRSVPEGEYTVLTITDTGIGMDRATQSRIFEPFFTTKGEKGTGLGLATIHGFITQLGGGIIVDSVLQQGSTFSLYFPACERTDPVGPSVEDEHERAPASQRRILLVEDNLELLRLSEQILMRLGHDVQPASSGEQGWEILQSDTHFDLLLTDLTMPGPINGLVLARNTRHSLPELPIVFMSGTTDPVLDEFLRTEDDVVFLSKPVSLQKYRQVLDSIFSREMTVA